MLIDDWWLCSTKFSIWHPVIDEGPSYWLISYKLLPSSKTGKISISQITNSILKICTTLKKSIDFNKIVQYIIQ